MKMKFVYRALAGLGVILLGFSFCKLGLIAVMNNRFDLCYLCIAGALVCLYASFGGFNKYLEKYGWFED
jgi:hypothetical protein